MNSDQYKDYSLEELASDPTFRAWVLNPTKELDRFWSSFLTQNPQQRILVQNAQTLVLSVQDYFGREEIPEEQLDRYFQQIKRMATNADDRTGLPLLFTLPRMMAATVAILILASLGLLILRTSPPTQVFQTQYGERLQVELPDGSTAKLNANSELKMRKNWRGNKREVWLDGEAFFTVKKAAKAGTKFTVHTRGLDIEVLGTQFNVNTRLENTKVILKEGEVRLLTQSDQERPNEVLLQPGELADYSKKTGLITTQKLEQTETYLSWKDGYLIYERATIREVMQDIRSTYGLDVRITDSTLLEKTIRGALPNDNLSEFLEMVETLFNVEITQSGDQILIAPGKD